MHIFAKIFFSFLFFTCFDLFGKEMHVLKYFRIFFYFIHCKFVAFMHLYCCLNIVAQGKKFPVNISQEVEYVWLKYIFAKYNYSYTYRCVYVYAYVYVPYPKIQTYCIKT